MPWAIYAAAGKHPPTWLFIDFMLIAVSFHFLNVIKDLEWDRAQAVMGLLQRLGKTLSIATAAVLVAISVAVAIF